MGLLWTPCMMQRGLAGLGESNIVCMAKRFLDRVPSLRFSAMSFRCRGELDEPMAPLVSVALPAGTDGPTDLEPGALRRALCVSPGLARSGSDQRG